MAVNKWIQKAVDPANKGKLRSSLKAKKGKNIPIADLRKAANKPGLLGQRARFALNLRKKGS